MLSDLNRVDLNTVHLQSNWVFSGGCEGETVKKFEREFKKTLQEQSGLGERKISKENFKLQEN